MDISAFITSDVFAYVVLPLLIFLSRIVDVSLGTLRVIFISKGYKLIAPLLGFFEVIIWLLAIAKIMENLSNVFCYLAYGLGFAAGTFTGMYLEEKMSIGKVLVRIITKHDASELLESLKAAGFNVTGINAEGHTCKVKLIFAVVSRGKLDEFQAIMKHYQPNAFYSVEDVRYANENEPANPPVKKYRWLPFGFYRKGK